jgi:outer membrane protein OmpA-like peptidoglycan-associated protein
MKKALILGVSSLMMIAFLSSCGQVKEPTVGSGSDYVLDSINKQVKDFSIDGFKGGSATVDNSENLENMKNIVSIVKPIITKIPDGYAMEITGHCADYDTAAIRKNVSTARAKKVYDELKKAGTPEAKMTYRGAGAEEPDPRYGTKDPKQRRVSFKAVKK